MAIIEDVEKAPEEQKGQIIEDVKPALTPAEEAFIFTQAKRYGLNPAEALLEVSPEKAKSLGIPASEWGNLKMPAVENPNPLLDPVEAATGFGAGAITAARAGKSLGAIALQAARDAAGFQTMGITELPTIAKNLPKAISAFRQSRADTKAVKSAVSEGVEDAMNTFRAEVGKAPEADLSTLASDLSVIPGPPRGPKTTPTPKPVPPVIQAAQQIKEGAGFRERLFSDVRNWFAPASVSPAAEATAVTIRAEAADFSLRQLRAEHALQKAAQKMDELPVAAQRHFAIAMEGGFGQGDPELDAIARALKDIMNSRHKELAKLKILRTFYDDYFPHIWKNPTAASAILSAYSKRTLAGTESFTKRRSLPTIADGINAGLELAVDNPVTATLLKLREVDKSIMGHKIAAELKNLGLARYFRMGQERPEGWVALPDKIFKVFAKPEIKITEAFDSQLMQGLTDFANSLGIRHTRGLGPPTTGRIWGASERGRAEIYSRFGGPESVLAHEIGHQLGRMFPEIDALVQDPRMLPQILSLANARWSGAPNPVFQRYVESIPERHAVLLESFIHAPDVMKSLAPDVYNAWMHILAANPRLAPVLNIKPGLVLGSGVERLKAPGLSHMGDFYGPRDVAFILNRYLSPGAYQATPFDPSMKGTSNVIFDLTRGLGNQLNQAQLGMSAFHLLFTTFDTAMSTMDVGLRSVLHGIRSGNVRFIRNGIADVAKSLTPFYAPIESILRGDKMMKEVFAPGTQGAVIGAYLKAMTAAGGRPLMDQFYHNQAVKRLFDTFKSEGIMNKIPLAWRWFPALFELTSKPVMEMLVPRMKMGVFMKMAELEINKLPSTATSLDFKKVLAKSWDSVDNRLGQLVYDNLFWNRVAKDTGMLLVRSLGWNIGTIREVGGGLFSDFPKAFASMLTGRTPEFTPKMGYVISLFLQSAIYGSLLHLAFTGEPPATPIDMLAPRTGYTRPNGTDDRVMLPTYMRDLVAFSNEGPLAMAKNKLNPWIVMTSGLATNRDFFGALIRDPLDPLDKQTEDLFTWIADQYFPIGVKASAQASDTYGDSPMKFLPIFGITPAPGYIENREGIENKLLKYPRKLKMRREGRYPPMTERIKNLFEE